MTGAGAAAPRDPRPGATLAALAVLIALNPLTYALHRVVGGLFPDSLTYLTFGRELLRTGRLALEGWGHVDAGVILPPLYPALAAALGRIGGDAAMAAYAVSTAAALAALVPLLAIGRRLAGLGFAFAALAVAQVHPWFLQYGAAALTEPLFLLVLATSLWLALRYVETGTGWRALGLGLAAGVLFLTRHVGGFLWPVLSVVVLAARLRAGERTRALAHAGLVTTGFALLAGAYAAILYAQTGHWPTAPKFRLERYVVTAPAGTPTASAADDYQAAFAERRERRQLLPDGSEMIGAALPAASDAPPAGSSRLARLPRNLAANAQHLAATLGIPGLVLVALACLTPALGSREPAALQRWLLPVAIVGYLGAVSLFTGAIARYVEVVVPLALLQLFGEARRLAAWRFPETSARRATPWIVAGALAAAVIATLPATFASLTTGPRIGEAGNPLAPCRVHLPPGAPVFAFHPIGPYLLGGTYRVVPNDTLERVLRYAALTGVRHLVILQTASDEAERGYYGNAPWLRDPAAFAAADVTPVCRSEDGVATLYALPAAPL